MASCCFGDKRSWLAREVNRKGGRGDVMKVVYVRFKKAGMSREEFRGYWKDTHAPIAKEMPGLKEYVQNHALVDPEGHEPPYDGFDEL
jgi:uncharacterized protein (TIGR02118 family)